MTINPLEQKIREMALEQAAGDVAAKKSSDGAASVKTTGFKDVLGQLVTDVGALQKDAESSIHEFSEGSTADVSKKMAEADAAYTLMMQIRHKLVDVYSAVDTPGASAAGDETADI